MDSYRFFLVDIESIGSIETMQIVHNSVFGVFSAMESINDDFCSGSVVLQWDLNQKDVNRFCDEKVSFTRKVLRVINSCSVVAILGK